LSFRKSRAPYDQLFGVRALIECPEWSQAIRAAEKLRTPSRKQYLEFAVKNGWEREKMDNREGSEEKTGDRMGVVEDRGISSSGDWRICARSEWQMSGSIHQPLSKRQCENLGRPSQILRLTKPASNSGCHSGGPTRLPMSVDFDCFLMI
jgi:hypothetical protein